jgi:amyloid beta precursor protein binding protein 1
MAQNKYDRQVRLWGALGQRRLSEARVCLLGAGAAGTETLKNLVLPGVGHVTVVDAAAVGSADLACNFFVSRAHAGQPRARAALELLLEMNEDVRGEAIVRDPETLAAEDPGFFAARGFSLVVATQMSEAGLRRVAAACWEARVSLVALRCVGLLGALRLQAREHCVLDARLESIKPDLFAWRPFPALRAIADATDLAAGGRHEHSHIPFLVLLIKAIDAWRAASGVGAPAIGAAPLGHESATFSSNPSSLSSTSLSLSSSLPSPSLPSLLQPPPSSARKALVAVLESMRRPPDRDSDPSEENFDEAVSHGNSTAFLAGGPGPVPAGTRAVLEHEHASNLSSESPTFWFVVRALRDFVAAEGALPVSGVLPDMHSTTDAYTALQVAFRAKAEEDTANVLRRVEKLRAGAGLAPALAATAAATAAFTGSADDDVAMGRRGGGGGGGGGGGPPASAGGDVPLELLVPLLCRNSRQLRVMSMSPLDGELALPVAAEARSAIAAALDSVAEDVAGVGLDEEGEPTRELKLARQSAALWYLVLRAADRFSAERGGRAPGAGLPEGSDAALNADAAALWACVQALAAELGLDGKLPAHVFGPEHAAELVRAGGGEMHTVAAFMGGVASQEAIKLITGQFVPLDNTIVFNGVSGCTTVWRI